MSSFLGGVFLGLVGGIVIAALILQPTGTLTQGMLSALIGGLLAISGGWFAHLHLLRSARKIKMDEAVAARKVTANAEAYRNIKIIEGAFIQIVSDGAAETAKRFKRLAERMKRSRGAP